jgi:TM2 domain-containing membrane protein YozV
MGDMITKPDANPILYGALNFLILGGVGYFIMGQSGKGTMAIVYVLVCQILLGWIGIGVLLSFGLQVAFAYDAYLLGQKLQAGESIGQKENALAFLNNLPGFK